MEEEIGEGRWFVTMLVEPDPHIRQSLGQIVSIKDKHFRHPHGCASR
jgi:hypothetical protein